MSQLNNVILLNILLSILGLAFGLAIALAFRLYRRAQALGIKVYVLGTAAVLAYALIYSLTASNRAHQIIFEMVALTSVVWALLGAHWYLNSNILTVRFREGKKDEDK